MRKIFISMFISAGILFPQKSITLADFLEKCKEKWQNIETYECRHESYQKLGEKEDRRVYKVYFKKPEWIRLKVLEGNNKGSEVMYNPETKKVRGRKGGIIKGIVLTLSPDDKRVVSLRGYKVYQAGIGEIYKRLFAYEEKGYEMEISVYEIKNKFKGWKIEVQGIDPAQFFGAQKEIFLIREDFIPYQCEQWDENGNCILRSTFFDVQLNPEIEEEVFKL